MPTIAFQGFSSGSQVALSAAQGGNSASNSVATWGQSNVASLNIIQRTKTSLIAPASVYLEAIELAGFSVPGGPGPGEIYDRSFHEVTYIWTVHPPVSMAFQTDLKIPQAWKNPNVYYGKEVAIAFNDPGTYVINLWAVDRNGNSGTATHQIVVGAADTAFPGTNTICYSASDFDGAPAGAVLVNSLATLNAALSSRGNAANLRLMFKGGDSFTLGGAVQGNAVNSLAVTSFGAGGRAELKLLTEDGNTPALFDAPSSEIKFYDINMTGDWDASKEQGIAGGGPVHLSTLLNQMYHRVTLSGAEWLTTCYEVGDCFFCLSDCVITNWRSIGLYVNADKGGNKYLGLVGTSIRQHPDAPQGGSVLGHYLGPIRIETTRHVTMHACDLFTRTGWSGGAVGTADQPCLRLNSSTADNVFMNFDRIVCEGGYQVIKMRGEEYSRQEVPGNYVFDKLLTIGTPETEVHLTSAFGGVTIRNHVGFEPNVPKLSNGTFAFVEFDIDDGQEQAINQNSDVSIYSSTYLNLLSAANNNAQQGDRFNVHAVFETGDFVNFTQENVLQFMPNQGAPETATPLDTTTALNGAVMGFLGRRESLPSLDASGNGLTTLTLPYTQLVDKNGAPTNQTYWQTAAANGDQSHFIKDHGQGTILYAQLGHFSVIPDPGGLSIVRNGSVWPSGHPLELKLDHASLGMALDHTYDTTGSIVPAPTPLSAQNASGGLIAEDQFDGTPRRGSHIPNALSGTPTMGAIEFV